VGRFSDRDVEMLASPGSASVDDETTPVLHVGEWSRLIFRREIVLVDATEFRRPFERLAERVARQVSKPQLRAP